VRHHYYSDQWQILEERLNSSTTADKRFVWGLRYIDDLILRDHGGTRHYVLHDYFNVTAIVNTSGTVQERYGYDAFGAVRFLNASFGSASSSYTWETLYGAYRYDSNTGLYQVRHRYLHPQLGRWTKRDPFGERGFATTHHRAISPLDDGPNLYAYAKNDPQNRIDIQGLLTSLQYLYTCYNRLLTTEQSCECICAPATDTYEECKKACMKCYAKIKKIKDLGKVACKCSVEVISEHLEVDIIGKEGEEEAKELLKRLCGKLVTCNPVDLDPPITIAKL
jgi:RHS repeat-associated protein